MQIKIPTIYNQQMVSPQQPNYTRHKSQKATSLNTLTLIVFYSESTENY